MSFAENVESTGNKLVTNYNTAKLAVWNPRTTTGSITGGGSAITLRAGAVIGRIAATGKLVSLDKNASDGSEFPLGILLHTTDIAIGETKNLTVVVEGDIAEELVICETYGTTLDSVIGSKTLRDRIGSDTVGIKLVTATEMTDYDNQ